MNCPLLRSTPTMLRPSRQRRAILLQRATQRQRTSASYTALDQPSQWQWGNGVRQRWGYDNPQARLDWLRTVRRIVSLAIRPCGFSTQRACYASQTNQQRRWQGNCRRRCAVIELCAATRRSGASLAGLGGAAASVVAAVLRDAPHAKQLQHRRVAAYWATAWALPSRMPSWNSVRRSPRRSRAAASISWPLSATCCRPQHLVLAVAHAVVQRAQRLDRVGRVLRRVVEQRLEPLKALAIVLDDLGAGRLLRRCGIPGRRHRCGD